MATSTAIDIDPITAEVVRSAMETVCFEMATYVSRTATTPILNQSNERNATILDGKGRLAALSVGIPQFMLTSTLPVRCALEFLGVDEFRHGDVFVANDPYHGGGHLPDFNVFAPVFEKKNTTGINPAGLDALRQACLESIPVLALGGVTLQNAESCLQAGAAGIAAIRLFQENDVAMIVRGLRGG